MQGSTATRCLSEASEGSASKDDDPRTGRLLAAAAAAVLGMILLLTAAGVQAASITVDSTADDTNPGHCTLREAINSANHGASSDTGSCKAGDGDDTIRFSVSGVIMLTSSLPEVARTLTIQGPAQGPSRIMVDGAGAYRVMMVSSGAALTLANLTIENGFITGGSYSARTFGAGILNNGTLTVLNSTFSGNSAGTRMPGSYDYGGGVANFGTLTVTNSSFSNNHADGLGGGIYSYLGSTLIVRNSTFSGNTVGRLALFTSGGGIASYGTLAVTDSTFSANIANNIGGGILIGPVAATVTNSTFSGNSAAYYGGGIFNNGGTLTVTNSSFFGNAASSTEHGQLVGRGGGIGGTTLTVTNATFFRNTAGMYGGGIYGGGFYGSVNLKSSILADNTISGDDTPENCYGTIADVGYNISDDDSCSFTEATSVESLNPLLDPAGLKDNGGPTETVALQSNSPAIDAIPFEDCTDQASQQNRITTDQRGALRPDAAEDTCDIGAYEFQDFAGKANCPGQSVSALAHHHGNLAAAALAYGFPSVKALQSAIRTSCGE